MIDSFTPVASGARPFFFSGGSIGILVVHGYGGSIGDYRTFSTQLHQRQYTVAGMRVAGHGQGIGTLARSDLYDWRESVFTAARALRQQCSRMFIVGASFGGALVLDYAAHVGPAVSGIVIVNTPMVYKRAGLRKFGLYLLRMVTPNLPKFGLGRDEKKRYAELGSTVGWPISGLMDTLKFIRMFVRPALSRIRQPMLVMKNTGDPYVDNRSAADVYQSVGSIEKYLVTIPGQTHRPFRDPAAVEFMAAQVHQFVQSIVAKKP